MRVLTGFVLGFLTACYLVGRVEHKALSRPKRPSFIPPNVWDLWDAELGRWE
jgi:hypothetical protein